MPNNDQEERRCAGCGALIYIGTYEPGRSPEQCERCRRGLKRDPFDVGITYGAGPEDEAGF